MYPSHTCTFVKIPKLFTKKNKSDKRTYFFVNGGTDEARTRDLLRDRQTL